MPGRRTPTASCSVANRLLLASAQMYQSAFVVVTALAAFLEPGMLVGRVRVHLVDDDLEAELVRTFNQRIEVVERAEHRVDVQ